MNNNLFFFLIFIISIPSLAQVGVNTDAPTATLDINGNLRIRGIQEEVIPEIATDSVLVMSRNGTVNRIKSKNIINAVMKTAVKGSFSGTGAFNLSLGAGTTFTDIPFDNEIFDYNDEFEPTGSLFTAKQDGIYDVSVQIKASSSLSASVNYGVCILKNGVVNAKEDFSNISVTILGTGINVSPNVRKVSTLLLLNTGDTVNFQLYSDLLNVSLSANQEDSFFTIVQIR